MMNEFHRYKECIELGSTPLSEVELLSCRPDRLAKPNCLAKR